MPPIVLDHDDDNDTFVPEPDPVAIDPGYEGVTVDTARHDVSKFLVTIEGSSWTVDYYSQMLGNDSETQSLQLDLDPAYQQYTGIYGMELKVTTALDSSMTDDTGGMTTTGTAVVYPYLIPNQGDMFVADTGDGRKGLFTVTNVERRTILKETCHEITYQMVSYLTDEYKENLELKTIRKTYFRRDLLVDGQNPFLISSDAEKIERLYEHKRELLGRYIKTFLDSEYKTLLEPRETDDAYDHFLTKAVTSVFGVNDQPLMREVNIMNCDGDDLMNEYTLWDCLLDMDDSMLSLAVKTMKLLPTHRFQHAPIYRGIAYSGIRTMYYPDIDKQIDPYSPSDSEQPLIRPPHDGGTYIFSPAFYDGSSGMTVLESEARKAIEGKAVDHAVLDTLAKDSYQWDESEQFFYLPILIILLKVAERRL